MKLRLGTKADLPQLEQIIAAAVEQLHDAGIDQWQKGYPNVSLIEQDIEKHQNYVLDDNGQILGMFMFQRDDDVSYGTIDGAWLNSEPYASMHRVCVAGNQKGRGVAGIMFRAGIDMAKSLGFSNMRIDTHPENHRMRHALEKAGYVCCGEIHLADGPEKGDVRVGYHLLLDHNHDKYNFAEFKEIIAELRSGHGCPWDREQTHESLKVCLTDESQEVLDAIDNHDMENLCEELGDVLLQVVLNSQIASENRDFTLEDVIDGVSRKMIRRHPHVFGDVKVNSAEESLTLWREIKKQEKEEKKNI